MADTTLPRIAGFDRQIAVAIGIGAYGHGVPALDNARGDAERVAALLAGRHGYEAHLRLDGDADLASLSRLFERELPRLVTARSQLLVYFAGHGVAHEDAAGRLDGFLLPSDAHASGGSWLPMASVRRWLEPLPCHHLLLILDCCFAGVFARARYRDLERDDRPLYHEQYEYLLRRRAYHLLASAAHDERAIDRLGHKRLADAAADDGGSPFARALVAGIGAPAAADRNGDGVVTVSELYDHVRRALGTLGGVPQTPNLWPLDWHDAGEYLFALRPPSLPPAPPPGETANPYRGLRHFEVVDEELFHGRDEIADEVADRARASPLVVLVGASGSGKSSLLHAGVVPRLRRARVRVIGPLRPGASALHALDELLAREGAEAAPAEAGRATLVVDQLDELISAGHDPVQRELIQVLLARVPAAGEARAALEARAAALIGELPAAERAAAERAQVALRALGVGSLIVALRSDMEPHFTGPGRLGALAGAAWQAGRTLLRPMNREQLRACIEQPAARQTFFFTPIERDGRGLVDALLDEVDQVPGALPLLSVALERMFDACVQSGRGDRTIGWSEYPAQGGVTGALQDKANQLLAARDEAGRDTLRRVLLRMVALRGRDLARRAVFLSELSWGDPDEDRRVRDALDELQRAGLVVRDRDAAVAGSASARGPEEERGVFVQPAHDALISGWPELLAWIEQDRHGIVVQRQLGQAVDDWTAHGDGAQSLWSDARIERLDELAEKPRGRRAALLERMWSTDYPIRRAPAWSFTARERAFVRASLRRRRRARLQLTAAICGVIVALSAITAFALRAREQEQQAARRAQEERDAANATARAYRARSEVSRRLDLALLMAVEAYEHHPSTETTAALREVLHHSPHLVQMYALPADGSSIAFDPVGRELAVGLFDGRVAFLETRPYGEVRVAAERAHAHAVDAIAFDERGARLVSGAWGGTIQVWDVATRAPVARMPDPPGPATPTSFGGAIIGIPTDLRTIAGVRLDGDEVSAVREGGAHVRWSIGAPSATCGTAGVEGVAAAVPFPEGRYLVAEWTGKLRDVRGPGAVTVLGEALGVTAIAADPAHGVAVTAGTREVKVWDLSARKPQIVLGVHLEARSIALSPSRGLVATGGVDGVIRLWSLADPPGAPRAELRGQPGLVSGLAFSSDGSHLASTGYGGTAILWRVDAEEPLGETLEGLRGPAGIAFAGDGRSMILAGRTGKFVMTSSPRLRCTEDGTWDLAAPIPETDRVAVAKDGRIAVLDAASRCVLASTPAPVGPVKKLAARGDAIVAILAPGRDEELWVGEVAGGEIRGGRRATIHGKVHALAIAHGRARVALGRLDGIVEVHDLDTGARWQPERAPFGGNPVLGVALGADGRVVAACGDNGRVAVWSHGSDEPAVLTGFTERVNAVAVGRFGLDIAAGTFDGRVLLWDGTSGLLIGDLLRASGPNTGAIAALAFRPYSTQLAVAASRGAAIRIDTDPRAWQRRACARANRVLGPDERMQPAPVLPGSPISCATVRIPPRRAPAASP